MGVSETPGPRWKQIARGAKGRLLRMTRGAARAVGMEPHRVSEAREYWETRGYHYRDEVASILRPDDPYYVAQQEFLDALAAFEWRSILEVGCGFGWHMKALRERFPDRRVHGVDFSFSQLRQAAQYLQSTRGLVQADASTVPFASDRYDVVFTSGLLVCIHPEGVAAVVTELARVARASVMTLEYAREHVASPQARATMDTAAWHGHRFSALYAEAGLVVERAAPFAAFAAQPERVPLSFFHGRKGGA
jgi:SAM-dependent methyltransferase